MSTPRIGWIGTGVMGRYMAEHLIKAGYTLSVFNRTQQKASPLVDLGAQFQSIPEIASQCEVVFTMLGYPSDVREVILGQDGLLNNMQPGSLLIDHTSSSPSLAQEIHNIGLEKGIESIDAPVSGGDVGAREGKLAIMVGANESSFTRAVRFFQCYGSNIQHIGETGMGQHAKLTNQIILAGNMIGMTEGLIYAYKAGLPVQDIIDLISTGAAGSTALKVLGTRANQNNYDPGFYVEHYVKDMELALDECRRMNISLPNLALVHQFYKSLVAHGEGRLGTQSLVKALQRMNNININAQFY